MAKLGSLFINLIADTAEFSSGLAKARSDLNSTSALFNSGLAKIDKSFKGISGSVTGFASELFSLKGAVGALFGIGAGGGLLALAKQAADVVGSLGEMASQAGVSTDTLQALRFAATQVNISQEEMDGALQKLNKTIGLAATGNKGAIESFNEFGIKILDAGKNVRTADPIMRDIADKIAATEDPAKRAAIAIAYFGKTGQQLLPLLENGASGVDALVQQAKSLGVVLDSETIAMADKASDSLAAMEVVIRTKLNAALVQLAPVLTVIATKMIDFITAVDRGIDRTKAFFGIVNEESLRQVTTRIETLYGMRDALQRSLSMSPNQPALKRELEGINDELVHLIEVRSKLMAQANTPATGTPGAIGVLNPTPPKTGKTDAEKNIDGLEKKLASLQAELDQLHMGSLEADIDKNLQGFDLSSEKAKQLAQDIAIVTAEIEAKKKAEADDAALIAETDQIIADATDRYNKRMEEGKHLTESLRTPTEQYADTILHLGEMLRSGAIDQTTYNRAIDEAKDSFKKADQATIQWSGAMTELGATFTSAFEDAVVQGKSLSDVLNGLLQDIERILLRLAENQFLGNSGSGGGWLDSLISGAGSIFSSFFGGGGGYEGATTAGYQGALAWGFHGGGRGAGEAAFARVEPMAAWAGAPRLHTGSLRPNEFRAILDKRETVLTPAQMAQLGPAGGGSDGPVVQIIDQRGTGRIDREEDTDPSGRQRVKFILRDEVKTQITSGTLDRSMKSQYGLNAQPKKRRS